MRHLSINEDGEPGTYHDDSLLTSGNTTYNPTSNTWDATITNMLDPGNILSGAEILVTGWRRGRFDIYRDHEDEPLARGRAFGSKISIDIYPGKELRLHITQDPRAKTSAYSPPRAAPEPAAIDARAKLKELQAQINELAEQL